MIDDARAPRAARGRAARSSSPRPATRASRSRCSPPSRGYRCVDRDAGGLRPGQGAGSWRASAPRSCARPPPDPNERRDRASPRDRRARPPAPSSPTSSPTPSIPEPTSRRPDPRSPARWATRSTRGSRASGRRGPSSGVARYLSRANPRTSSRGRRAAGLDPRRRRRRGSQGRGRRALLLPGDPGPRRRSTRSITIDGRRGLRRVPAARARGGPSRRRLLGPRRGGRAPRGRSAWGPARPS